MSNRTNSDKAKVHAERPHWCSCGKVVRGNGGRASHAAMHARKGDSQKWTGDSITREGHYWMTADKWREMWTVECPACGGTGSVGDSTNPLKRNPCYGCGWTGRVPKERT